MPSAGQGGPDPAEEGALVCSPGGGTLLAGGWTKGQQLTRLAANEAENNVCSNGLRHAGR